MLSYLSMFLLALSLELCGAGYTLALARGQDRMAVVLSAANAVLGWGLMLFVVYDTEALPAAIVGEIFGTMAALRLSRRKALA